MKQNGAGKEKRVWSLAVFCGSRIGNSPEFDKEARTLGSLMAERNVRLVFGAGHVGLMGVLADAVLEKGGEALGVIPQALVNKELAHGGLTELVITQTMHERKAIMADQADAFVALPGGFGTLDELFEILTWAQLGIHQKPVALLDGTGFYSGLLDWMQTLVNNGFVKLKCKEMLRLYQNPIDLLDVFGLQIDQIRTAVQARMPDIR